MPSLTPRRLTPELLDILPADDRSAVESRRDLARLNWIMRNDAIIAQHLKTLSGDRPPRTILDLGGGDGTFTLRIARRLARVWPKMSVTLLDRQNIVSETTRAGFAELGWHFKTLEADVFSVMTALVPDTYDVIVTNLFLHHFEAEQLRQLLAEVRYKTKLFIATEPRRGAWGLTATRMVGALGCNSVTRHDARVSVEAGFAADELTQAWTCHDAWKLEERRVGPFTHFFSASRVADDAL
jgi:2-polyprenyl-3-methyl-5-hydroxy-6-metoxy-1,4-benzoquinol methylase